MPVTTKTKEPRLAYIDGHPALLFWKTADQLKPYAIAVLVVDAAVSPEGNVMVRVKAKAGPGAPDGVDDWIQRDASMDVGHRTCTDVIDGMRVLLAWKPGTKKPTVVLAVKLVRQHGRGKNAMYHVAAPPSAMAPDGINMWLPPC